MANEKLKAKAQARSKSNGSSSRLATKAKSRAPAAKAETVEEIERDEGMGPQVQLAEPGVYDRPPPLPPALLWLRKRATIPALRGGGQG